MLKLQGYNRNVLLMYRYTVLFYCFNFHFDYAVIKPKLQVKFSKINTNIQTHHLL